MSNAETLSLYLATCNARALVARTISCNARATGDRVALSHARSIEVKCLREAIQARRSVA